MADSIKACGVASRPTVAGHISGGESRRDDLSCNYAGERAFSFLSGTCAGMEYLVVKAITAQRKRIPLPHPSRANANLRQWTRRRPDTHAQRNRKAQVKTRRKRGVAQLATLSRSWEPRYSDAATASPAYAYNGYWNLSSEVDLPPAGPAVITRVCRFDIRAAPPAQARRA